MMSLWGLVTVVLGVVSAVGCILAMQAGRRLKARSDQTKAWITLYWGALAGYAVFFSIQRLAAEAGASDDAVTMLYFIATISGASTLVALSAIILQALLRPWTSGFLTGTLTGLAAWIVYLIIVPGVIGPMVGIWSVEFLPSNVPVRVMIALVYMGTPLIFAALIHTATRNADALSQRRFRLFTLSVVLVYEANAVKYVVALPDVVHLLLAATMAVGILIGWRSYLVKTTDTIPMS